MMQQNRPSHPELGGGGDGGSPTATVTAATATVTDRASVPVVLVVDDERSIRELLRQVLERAGYHVVVAAHGGEAMERFVEARGTVDLVITDVRMPEMTGPELAARLAAVHSGVKVLYISGYGPQLLAPHRPDSVHAVFLQKPFTSTALLAKVEEMIG